MFICLDILSSPSAIASFAWLNGWCYPRLSFKCLYLSFAVYFSGFEEWRKRKKGERKKKRERKILWSDFSNFYEKGENKETDLKRGVGWLYD